MKHTSTFTTLTLIATLGLTGCGDSSTDTEALPEGVAPSDAQQAPPEADASTGTDEEPTGDPTDDVDSPPEASDPGTTPLELGVPGDEPAVDDPPGDPEPEAARVKVSGMSFVVPDGWSTQGGNTMRVVTLVPPAEFNGAVLAVSYWPRGVGEFSGNVMRWAGQAGVQFVDAPKRADFESFKVDGIDSTWVPLTGEGTSTAILSAWVPTAGDPDRPMKVWIFKLTCQSKDAEKLATDMRAWCESIKFE